MPKLPSRPPESLISAFRAAESIEDVASLAVEEGFDPEAMRVLAAWRHSDHLWFLPKTPCPDPSMPTARAWAWLVSGWSIDVRAIARAADVSESCARQKFELLLGNHLIYPDGSMSKPAQAALRAHVAKRVRGSAKRKPPEDSN